MLPKREMTIFIHRLTERMPNVQELYAKLFTYIQFLQQYHQVMYNTPSLPVAWKTEISKVTHLTRRIKTQSHNPKGNVFHHHLHHPTTL